MLIHSITEAINIMLCAAGEWQGLQCSATPNARPPIVTLLTLKTPMHSKQCDAINKLHLVTALKMMLCKIKPLDRRRPRSPVNRCRWLEAHSTKASRALLLQHDMISRLV